MDKEELLEVIISYYLTQYDELFVNPKGPHRQALLERLQPALKAEEVKSARLNFEEIISTEEEEKAGMEEARRSYDAYQRTHHSIDDDIDHYHDVWKENRHRND